MAGVDIRTAQELMGHKTIQVTLRYAHLAPQHQLEAVQRLCDTGLVLGGSTDTRTTGTNGSESSTTSMARPTELNPLSSLVRQYSKPGWRNWQTQRTQNPPRATAWGFDPPSRHHKYNNLHHRRFQAWSRLCPFFVRTSEPNRTTGEAAHRSPLSSPKKNHHLRPHSHWEQESRLRTLPTRQLNFS
jgi:hypothetical protein